MAGRAGWAGEEGAGVCSHSNDLRKLDTTCHDDHPKFRSYRALLKAAGPHTLPITLLRSHNGAIEELVPRAALQAHLVKAGVLKKEPASSSDTYRKQQKADAEKRKKERAIRIAQLQALDDASARTVKAERETLLMPWLQIVVRKLAAGADADVCKILVKTRGIDPSKHKREYGDGVRESVAAAGREVDTYQDAMTLTMQLLTAVHYGYNGNKDPLPEFCALFKVDAAQIEKQIRASLDKRKKPAKAKSSKKKSEPGAGAIKKADARSDAGRGS